MGIHHLCQQRMVGGDLLGLLRPTLIVYYRHDSVSSFVTVLWLAHDRGRFSQYVRSSSPFIRAMYSLTAALTSRFEPTVGPPLA